MNKLILLRHGQSQWNFENRFTGWTDVPLTKIGEFEAKKAGQLLKKNNIKIDIVFCSILERSYKTAEIAIEEAGFKHLISENNYNIIKDKKLNERDYGDLVGLNKEETALKFGKEQVHIWRRSFDKPPPNGESLKNVVDRVSPYYDKNIKPFIDNNKNVLISAHGNSLRAIMIKINLYKDTDISKIELPTGSPFCITFSEKKLIESYYLN